MADFSRFLDPPRLRTVEEGFEERHATWLELFFDLVFVVAVAELGLNLVAEPTLEGFFQYVGLFIPIIWAWAGFTVYANRFDTDDLTYRLLILLAMFAVAALATNTPHAVENGGEGFAVSYILVRLVLLGLYARAIRHVPQVRPLTELYFSAFSIGVLIWLISLLVPPPARWWLWGLDLAFELVIPIFAWRRVPGTPIDPRHLPERYGLLTIIVLGESVLAVVLGVAQTSWELDSGAAAAGGFLAAAAVWWLYFDYLDESVITRSRTAGLIYVYAHFPVIIGIATMGVAVQLQIRAVAGEMRYDDTAWILCAGTAFCMVGLAAIQLAVPPMLIDADVVVRLSAAVLALVLLAFSFRLPTLAVVWAVAAVLAAQVIFELGRHDVHADAGNGVELDL
jgi:low temperature requirement protein LtrA